MNNKYRLSSSGFDREKEEDKIEPHIVFFLSVEGNDTEVVYFEGIKFHKNELHINAIVNVEVLRRRKKDTQGAPIKVVELLEEYLRLREHGKENLIDDIPHDVIEKYGVEFIRTYLESPEKINKNDMRSFNKELTKIGYDITYRNYLLKYDNDCDEFAILIDRDRTSKDEENMREIIRYCREKKYSCYITNPCFEFWLLLHVSNIKDEYSDKYDKIAANEKVSNRHTYVSKELSNKLHHGKSRINFEEKYLPYIDLAIKRAKEFASNEEDLVTEIGSNIWKLIERMRNYKE
ncbi:MAG: RloB family protein [Lachnoclostridium sp.]|nr:RloB family protein [Lachnoclostridium sp.]